MASWIGNPLTDGIVVHNLGTQELASVSLWYVADDLTRSSRQPVVKIINDDIIRVQISGQGTMAGDYPLTEPTRFIVIVTPA